MSKEAIEKILIEAGGKLGNGGLWLCPFHNDTNPSGSLYHKGDKWRYHCFGCNTDGDEYDLQDLFNKQPKGTTYKEKNGIKKEINRSQKTYTLEEIKNGGTCYDYYNPEKGKVDFIVKRRNNGGGTKEFTQYSLDSGGRWIGRGVSPVRLYIGSSAHAERIEKAEKVVVCEGEKCVHALHKVGIVATTKAGGAQGADKADWSILKDKVLYLWPDNDAKGIGYMHKVEAILLPIAKKVYWIDPKKYELPNKGDAYDYCKAIKWDKKLAQLPLDEAAELGIAGAVISDTELIITGRKISVSLPWSYLWQNTQALIPQTTTLICGEGGHGKSLFMLQMALWWHEEGIPWCLFELEDDRTNHLTRALAQRIGNANFMDYMWKVDHAEEARKIVTENREWMDSFGKHIWEAPIDPKSRNDLVAWMEERAKDGYRVICIDPVTMAEEENEVWKADKKFVHESKIIAREFNVSIVFITHPRSGQSKVISLDSLAGGSAYKRFSHTVIWVEKLDEPADVEILTLGRSIETINRRVHIAKVRNAQGSAPLGYWFNHDTLKFKELGPICKKKR